MAKVAALDEHHGAAAAVAHASGVSGFNTTGRLVTKWDIGEVCNWLRSAGFADMEPIFQRHQISGAVLPKLNDTVLKEMGVDIVGRRVLLMNEINKMQAIARAEWRNQVVWAGTQYRPGPCNGSLEYGFPFCCESCVGRPDMYTLTNSKLSVTRMTKNVNTPCTGFCGFSLTSDNIDLSDINDVDVRAATAAMGDPLGALAINAKTGFVVLALRSSECQKTAMLITNAKEEAAALANPLSMLMGR